MKQSLLATVVATGAIAAAALGTTAFGHPGTANAEPSWDIEVYDNCLDLNNLGINETQQHMEDTARMCCAQSGGWWNQAQLKCEAPPANVESARPLPTGGIPTTVLAPPASPPSTPEAPTPGSVR